MKAADFDLHVRLGGRWGRTAGRPAAYCATLSLLAAVNICVKPLHDGINPEFFSEQSISDKACVVIYNWQACVKTVLLSSDNMKCLSACKGKRKT